MKEKKRGKKKKEKKIRKREVKKLKWGFEWRRVKIREKKS